MDYNTSQPKMIIPEYGRNIQKMIKYAVTLEDREERNRAAKAIITIMGQLNPHLRDVTDFKHKLWDHLFIISEFQLDVDSPFPKPSRETFETKPDRVEYPHKNIKYKHYGHIIENLIKSAVAMEEGPMRNALVESIANLMKRSYLSWNRDSVNDALILQHLEELSKGALKLPENFRFSHTSDILSTKAQPQQPTHHPAKKKNFQQKGGGQHQHNRNQNQNKNRNQNQNTNGNR